MQLSRRGFSVLCLGAIGAKCATLGGCAAVPRAPLYIDLRQIESGGSRLFRCGRRDIVVRHLTAAEIAVVRELERGQGLSHPQADDPWTAPLPWIVREARCTHLGCQLIEGGGRHGGWLCPCHGSEFDPAGRVTRGPADLDLSIPPHRFVGDHALVLFGCGRDAPKSPA